MGEGKSVGTEREGSEKKKNLRRIINFVTRQAIFWQFHQMWILMISYFVCSFVIHQRSTHRRKNKWPLNVVFFRFQFSTPQYVCRYYTYICSRGEPFYSSYTRQLTWWNDRYGDKCRKKVGQNQIPFGINFCHTLTI